MAKQAGSTELAKLKDVAKQKFDEKMANLIVRRCRADTECRSNDSRTELTDTEYIKVGERTYSISITYADSDSDRNHDPYVPILPDEMSVPSSPIVAVKSDTDPVNSIDVSTDNKYIANSDLSRSNSESSSPIIVKTGTDRVNSIDVSIDNYNKCFAAGNLSRSNSESSTASSGKWV